jgi:hypothetical protein
MLERTDLESNLDWKESECKELELSDLGENPKVDFDKEALI